jgi:PEP-CTERM putative exosortase interaction domain
MVTRYQMAVLGVLLSLFVFGKTDGAQAYTFEIGNFSIYKNGGLMFNDPFDDGIPPPSAPNYANLSPALYFVHGPMGPETGGKLTLNSSDAPPATNVPGMLAQNATLNTNIDPSDNVKGLKSGMTFSVTGAFTLIQPGYNEMYGIALHDSTSGKTPDDYLELGVNKYGDNWNLQLISWDMRLNTREVLGSTTLDWGHGGVALRLMKAAAGSDAISGSYANIDGGIVGAFTSFGNTVDIFHGENWTRAEFLAVTPAPVPEPSTMLLLGSGLAGLVGYGRRRFKK